MKKAVFFVIFISFFIGSCTKEKSPLQEEPQQELVEVNGVLYDINDLRRKLSIMTGIEEERLYFVADKMAFYDVKYSYEFKLSDYIESINSLK